MASTTFSFKRVIITAITIFSLVFSVTNLDAVIRSAYASPLNNGELKLMYDAPQGVDGISLSYSTDGINWTSISNSPETLTNVSGLTVYLKATAPEGAAIDKNVNEYSEDPGTYLSIDGGARTALDVDALAEGSYSLYIDASKTYEVDVCFYRTRSVTINFDEASNSVLESGVISMRAGRGDKNDAYFQTGVGTSQQLLLDADGTNSQLRFSIPIDSDNYFIPYIEINGEKIETVDTGQKTSDNHVIIGASVEGAKAAVDTFNIKLAVFAQAKVNEYADSVESAEASYVVAEDGNAGIAAGADVELTINNAETDPMVEDALETLDLEVSVDGDTVSQTDAPITVTMVLDSDVYTADDYEVVRNHEGTVETLETEYDPESHTISFESDQYSQYSIVEANADENNNEVVEPGGEGNSLPNTGDNSLLPNALLSLVVAAGIALAVARTRKRNVNK